MDSNQCSQIDVCAEALADLRQIVNARGTVRHSPGNLPKKPSRLEHHQLSSSLIQAHYWR
jgi:hypothetical protein